MVLLLAVACSFFPIVGLPSIVVYYAKEKRPFACAMLLALTMAIISYGFKVTYINSDMYRYQMHALRLKNLSFIEALSYEKNIGSNIRNLPLSIAWLWAIGQIGDIQLLPASSAFILYFVVSYIAFDYLKDTDYSPFLVVLCILLVCLTVYYYGAVSALRSTASLLIGTLALYLNIGKQRHDILVPILYLAPFFLHAVGIVPLLLRIIRFFTESLPITVFIATLFSIAFLYRFSTPLSSIPLLGVVTKIVTYVDYDTEWARNAASGRLWVTLKFLSIMYMLVSSALLFLIRSVETEKVLQSRDDALWCAAVPCLSFSIALAIMVPVPSYLRFSYAIYPLTMLFILKHFVFRGTQFFESLKERKLLFLSLAALFFVLLVAINLIYLRVFLQHINIAQFIHKCLFGIFAEAI